MIELINIDSIFPNGLDLDSAFQSLGPVAVYVAGMALYAVFIFKFYRFVSSRDMFALDLSKYEESRFKVVRGFLHVVMYAAKYVILFPAFAFFWFAVLTLILTFLSKDRPFSDILLIALATVSTIRVSAYYNEDLSRDLAKILPFAVLAIFLIDASFFKVNESLDVLRHAGEHRETILYYLLFLIAVEFALRLILSYASFVISTRRRILARRAAARERQAAAPPPEDQPPESGEPEGATEEEAVPAAQSP